MNIHDENKIGKKIYKLNKRAKKIRELEMRCIGTEDGEKLKQIKKLIYKKKDELLSQFEPIAIHRQAREKVFNIKDGSELKQVTLKLNSYSLIYKIGTYTFHQPIAKDEYFKYDRKLVRVDENELTNKYGLKILQYV